MPLNSKYINVSGLPSFEEQKITFPSGVFGQPVEALLSSVNASFGFNSSPHRFDLEYVPELFSYSQLPDIGTAVDFTIGDSFRIKGKVVHSDYTKSDKGKLLAVSVEDIRTELNDVVLDTYGMYAANDAPTTSVIDVRYWFMKTHLMDRSTGRWIVSKDMERLLLHGASYRQIYQAIQYCETTLGTITGISAQIPAPEVIEAQLPGDPEAYRWKFRTTPLLTALDKILTDVAYDYYWDMDDSKISVINRKYPISINEVAVPVANDPAPTINAKYGYDKGENPTVVKLLGGQMEGVIGGAYTTTQGIYKKGTGVTTPNYDLGIGTLPLEVKLKPGWHGAVIKYYGPNGDLRDYTPTDRSLTLALKGIEYWAAETPGLESRISISSTQPDGTTTRLFNPGLGMDQDSGGDYADRIGKIENRAYPENSWQLEFYNRVRTFAQNYYGRLYVVEESNAFMSYFDDFEIIPEAWCNLENCTDQGAFTDGYKISDQLSVLAPFWNPQTNKLKAFAMLPFDTKWGEDGKAFPAQFENWTEELGYQFVPIEVKQWDNSNNKFDEEYVTAWQKNTRGISIKLPNVCWGTYIDANDASLASNEYLGTVYSKYQTSTRYDFDNPLVVPKVYGGNYTGVTEDIAELIDVTNIKVALPIRVNRRYGYNFPSIWSSGTGTQLSVEVKDEIVPWAYEPRGVKRSYQLMDDEMKAVLNSQIVSRSTVTFAEAQKVGLPIISFDGFADQNAHPEGFGLVQHGVTALSISKSIDGWWQTRYSVKSHFPQFLKVKPVQEDIEEAFKHALHRLKEDINNTPPDGFGISMPGILDNKLDAMGEQFIPTEILDKFDIEVIVDQVYERGGAFEYYSGKDKKGLVWPRALASSMSTSNYADPNYKIAKCTDGYLQVGMKAIYHFEELPRGGFLHFFTGGFPLTAGRIVEVVSSPAMVAGVWCSTVRTMPSTVTAWDGSPQLVTPFYFYRVPYVTQASVDQAIAPGDKLMMGSNLNKNNLTPGAGYGPNDANANTCYLVNTGGNTNTTMVGYVITKPNGTTGRAGVIQTVTATGGVRYTDGGKVGGDTYNVYFVGCNYDQIENGDYCVITKERETGGAYRLYCLITKPLFIGTDAFGD